MLDDEQLPSLSDIRFYLSREGWSQQPPGLAGALWMKNGKSVAVPEADDPGMLSSVIMQLAQQTRKSMAALAYEVKYCGVGRTEVGLTLAESERELRRLANANRDDRVAHMEAISILLREYDRRGVLLQARGGSDAE